MGCRFSRAGGGGGEPREKTDSGDTCESGKGSEPPMAL